MRVNIVSESEFFPKGQGVHSAFLNTCEMLRENGVEVLVNSRKKADLTHVHTIGPFSLYKLLRNKPSVVSAHVIPDSFIGSLVGARTWYSQAKSYLRFFYNRADLVLAVAPKVKEELLKMGVSKRVEVFPNPINEKTFCSDISLREAGRKKLGLKKDDQVVIGVGQIQPRKGLEDFINTAGKLPEIKFFWVGSRPFKKLTAQTEKMDQLIKNKPENFTLLSDISYEYMPQIYSAADVFLFPSYQENAPMAVIEAAACGLPLVMRDLEEYKLLYQTGSYAKGDNDTFAGEIQKLLKDKELYLQARENSAKLAEAFSFKILAPKLIKLYQELQ